MQSLKHVAMAFLYVFSVRCLGASINALRLVLSALIET